MLLAEERLIDRLMRELNSSANEIMNAVKRLRHQETMDKEWRESTDPNRVYGDSDTAHKAAKAIDALEAWRDKLNEQCRSISAILPLLSTDALAKLRGPGGALVGGVSAVLWIIEKREQDAYHQPFINIIKHGLIEPIQREIDGRPKLAVQQPFVTVDLPHLTGLIAKALEACPALPDNPQPDRALAGYFTLLSKATGATLSGFAFGDVPAEKEERYRSFSMEKALRLFANMAQHGSSFESRDPALDLWGGAINAHDFILSFSGMPELLDEAVMLIVAYQMGWLNWQEVNYIAQKSNNGFVEALKKALFL